jgi:hypothetical protein
MLSSSQDGAARPTGAQTTGLPVPVILPNTTSVVPIVPLNQTSTVLPNANSTEPIVTLNQTSPDVQLGSNATSPGPTRVSNATCTVNVPNASIDYWYPATYSHVVGTMTSIWGNFSKADSYTLVPATTTFDIASALTSDFACTFSESVVTEGIWTDTFCIDYFDKPTATETSLVYRTGFAPFPSGGVIPTTDARFYDIYTNLPTATHAISVAPNRTFDQVSATPFVHFTAYEVESGNKTETVRLPSAYVYPYWAEDVQHNVSATGPLPKEFLQQIGQADCDSGQLQATVTVVVVVDLYYENVPFLDPFLIHFESTALGFDDPVVINNEGSTRGVPLTMSDWELPGAPAVATPTPTNGRAVPTDPAGNNNNQQGGASNEAQPSVPRPTGVIIGTVGSTPVAIGPSSVVVVGSQTLQPGGPAIVIGGVTPVSLVPSATALVIGGSTTLQLPRVSNNPIPPPVLTVGSSTLTPNAATQFFVAPGQTLTPGGIATVDGTIVSLAPSASFVVIGGSTQLLPTAAPGPGSAPTSPPQIVIGGTTVAAQPIPGSPSNNNPNNIQNNAAPGPTFVVGGQTLAPGGQAITVGGTTLSLVPGGSSVVVNGVTSAVANPPAQLTQPSITVGNAVLTPASGSGTTYIVAGQTLAPGGQAVTVSGTVLSLAPSAGFIVVNGVTSTLANNAAAQVTTAPILTVGNAIFTPLPGTGTSYLVGSSTLTPGGVITVAGTTISLAPGATAIVINGQTSTLTPALAPITNAPITNAPLLTIGSNTFTAVSGTTYIIGGQTLVPGGTIVVDGTTISLAPLATELIYGSSGRSTSTALFPATTTRSQTATGVMDPSIRGTGNNGQATATSNPTGSAPAQHISKGFLAFVVIALGSWLC